MAPQTHVTLALETDPSEPYVVSESLDLVIRVPSTELSGLSQWTVRYRHKVARGMVCWSIGNHLCSDIP